MGVHLLQRVQKASEKDPQVLLLCSRNKKTSLEVLRIGLFTMPSELRKGEARYGNYPAKR
jgi:hypothetical protein